MSYEEFVASGGYGPQPVLGFPNLEWVKRMGKIYLRVKPR